MSNTKINMTGLVKFLATREKAIHSENVLREIQRYKPSDNRQERLMNFVRGNRALNEYDKREERRMTQIWLNKLRQKPKGPRSKLLFLAVIYSDSLRGR